MLLRRVRRTRKGDYEVRLPQAERRLLATIVPQLRAVVAEDAGSAADPNLRRLFPTAYPDDPALDREYHGLVADDLLARRLAALDTVAETVDATRLDEEQLLAWMGAVNDLRLVLGTRLDVSEDTDLSARADDPDADSLAVYAYLGHLLESIVIALSG
jgi:hypothetical protein